MTSRAINTKPPTNASELVAKLRMVSRGSQLTHCLHHHFCFPAAHLERSAARDLKDETGKPVAVFRQSFCNLLNRAAIVILQPPAQRVGEHLLRQAPNEILPLIVEHDGF